jgi:hypothetical protein
LETVAVARNSPAYHRLSFDLRSSAFICGSSSSSLASWRLGVHLFAVTALCPFV